MRRRRRHHRRRRRKCRKRRRCARGRASSPRASSSSSSSSSRVFPAALRVRHRWKTHNASRVVGPRCHRCRYPSRERHRRLLSIGGNVNDDVSEKCFCPPALRSSQGEEHDDDDDMMMTPIGNVFPFCEDKKRSTNICDQIRRQQHSHSRAG